MKNSKPLKNHRAIYNRLRSEWHIPFDSIRVRKMPLQELGVSELEVNWLLNKIEWESQCEIEEQSVSLQRTLADFVEMILKASQKPSASGTQQYIAN